jgi:hypothetical protein
MAEAAGAADADAPPMIGHLTPIGAARIGTVGGGTTLTLGLGPPIGRKRGRRWSAIISWSEMDPVMPYGCRRAVCDISVAPSLIGSMSMYS